ncbi:HAD family hydrolase [Nocardiopsis trehalosi]|jgi:putative hydrolase of the HAD superfamily|uniref:HAD family hydrolase n=1 Tax=Nocardiopsis trehalosi TaxID=109329 RepID=UPI00083561B5|nr:HAD family hydrolase [Nocardiopsis trehalosi]
MPDTTPAPAAVFFDLDDTLLDDHAASSAGLRTLMERLGHPEFSAARHLWDVQTEISFGAYVAGRLTLTEQRRERVRALATQAGHSFVSDEHCDELYAHYLAAHRSAWRAFDDVVPALTSLASAGIRLGVITNGIESLQHDKLGVLGIGGHFPVVVCADTAGAGKPDPRIFHLACHRLGVAPAQSWHVGDQLRADALGAVSAGLRPILIDRRARHTSPPAEVTTITGLPGLLRLIPAGTGLL